MPSQQTTPPVAPQVSPAKKRFPTWLKIISIVVVVLVAAAIIVAVVVTGATKAPQKVSDQFVNELQAGNTSAAYALTSESFQEATSEEQLDNIIKQVSPAIRGEEKITERFIGKTLGSPETVVLVYTINTSNGSVYIKTQLQKNDDTWKIINFRSDDDPLEAKIE
ncbi:MAG: hypothetical protein WBP26_00110 [Candidatus Saccharimonadales bacterium]